ncbi:Nif3-like dinuclear metal center hexameric protein [Crocinitomicaceae bacterium CZZ-1]|uniref:GTP cyclohydrolase 1 type 2 homolog n=1 Tax=Taishania pollutisoli TaxID=2766479 RepID=A0A8J6PJZ5_9FLAO|nr:Nif3-like dinuclear metal center hexameric protein [Taishania pollutisoli]MBC9812435.1 Nif3-like dinuclear metal center hexameric protein [Taishania pollutisoli]MBX2949328.1 Nif3-like dinuclear metal center hexameric protein [Crocinitomicaceae bacterium]NGF74407.1 Nif3-like dinuclear metal center hexameric protein [Fluviicola sp. SGL-29]
MQLKEIIQYLEFLAPLSSQESYDNSGLITGNVNMPITQALICLDSTEEVVDEAIENGCNLIIAHHPIVFQGLKSLTGKTYVERVVLKCIKNDIALYAIHTNLDNYRFGVNDEIGRRLGLENMQILSPKAGVLNKITVFVPLENREQVAQAMFNAGAGSIGQYNACSFFGEGTGTFTPVAGANPYIGTPGTAEQVKENRLEVLVSTHQLAAVVSAMNESHPYEEVAYDIVALRNSNAFEGTGMIGKLPVPMPTEAFLNLVKNAFNCGVIRHTKLVKTTIETVAFCGGSGSFLLKEAIRSKADVYITGDFKYHEFFDAEDKLIIADIGHFESEQYTINLLSAILTKKFPNFALRLTTINTNPINYF